MKNQKTKETFDFYQSNLLTGMNKDSKIVLVTGGAGFIGSNFI
ncbi:MAG TPA: dTDP-glucose 4,6-dehydratase, partial [Candidatus Cloacimonetes bacterium]|nr:dTDP-glucose 4,6-dehydratase [Candidatus Cloacimonadota bacterium]